MRIYKKEDEENLYQADAVDSWLESGLINKEQSERIKTELKTPFRETNIFFRILFAFFTAIFIAAVVGFTVWALDLRRPAHFQYAAVFIISAGVFYFCSEFIIRRYWVYRFGPEEALACGSVILSGLGVQKLASLFYSVREAIALVSASYFVSAFCFIYLRFGFLYAAFLGIIAFSFIPFQLSLPGYAERLFLFLSYGIFFLLISFAEKKTKHDFLKKHISFIQGFLAVAAYISVNLRISDFRIPGKVYRAALTAYAGFPPFFYWVTYALIILLPAALLYYGLKRKKRIFIDAGLVTAFLTIAVNKDYLGIRRYVWDPAILGFFLIMLVIFLNRRFSKKTKEWNGFTVAPLLKKSKQMEAVEAAGAVLSMPFPAKGDEFGGLGGGASGGGGTSRDY